MELESNILERDSLAQQMTDLTWQLRRLHRKLLSLDDKIEYKRETQRFLQLKQEHFKILHKYLELCDIIKGMKNHIKCEICGMLLEWNQGKTNICCIDLVKYMQFVYCREFGFTKEGFTCNLNSKCTWIEKCIECTADMKKIKKPYYREKKIQKQEFLLKNFTLTSLLSFKNYLKKMSNISFNYSQVRTIMKERNEDAIEKVRPLIEDLILY